MTTITQDLLFLLFHLALIGPGIGLGVWLFRRGRVPDATGALVLGYAVGYALAILSLVLLMYLRWPVWIAAAIHSLGWLLAAVPESQQAPRSGLLHGLFEDRAAWILGVTAVALTMIVLSQVGRVDGDQQVFSTLFVHDYFNHMAVTAEVAKQVPPSNIYYQGPTAHYYWFFHIVPGAFHRLLSLEADIRHLLAILAGINIMVLFGALYKLILSAGVSRRTAAICLSMVLAAYSYIDLFILGREFGNLLDLPRLIPALGDYWPRIEEFSGLSHSYMRDCFVEPHAVAGLSMAVGAILLQTGSLGRWPHWQRGFLTALLAVGTFGCDSFLGTILAVWIAVDCLIELYQRRDLGEIAYLAAGAVVPLAIGSLCFLGLEMVGSQGGMLSIRPMIGVIATLPFYLTLDYGPIFLLGIAGWWQVYKRKYEFAVVRLWSIGVIALFIGLFVHHQVEADVLLRKAGKPLQLALLVGAAIVVEKIMTSPGRGRRLVVGLLILAVPTLFLDLQAFGGFAGSRGLENRISVSQIKAMEWLRDNSDPNAIVQGMPGYLDQYKYDINAAPAIAQRPVAIGTYQLAALWGIGPEASINRIREVERMFNADSVTEVASVIDQYHISYLFLGPWEKNGYRLQPELFARNDSLFEVVYDQGGVTILRTRHARKQEY